MQVQQTSPHGTAGHFSSVRPDGLFSSGITQFVGACKCGGDIDPLTLTEALRNPCSWIILELQVSELLALTSVVFAVGATLAWTKFLHPKK